MLEVKDLKKNFGKKQVLKGINLKVNKGEIVGIIGPSGCGKSTFLRSINFLEYPSSGTITFLNEKIDSDKEITFLRRKVGMVFQQFNLFDNMTVLDNIILAPVKLNIMSKEKATKEAKELLKKIGLLDKENFYPSELSGGQKQRVAIIRTLLMKPEMILFDEPTSALDPEMIGEVTNLMREIAKEGMTMIIVSHEMNFIRKFYTRVLYMEDGKILCDGTPKEIFETPKHEELKKFLSKINNI